MKIVIDISDPKYKWIVDNPQIYTDDLCEAIRNGTPLPEHHGDLIDVDDLREDFKASKKISFAERMDISCIVDHAPIIIEGSDNE